MSPTNATVLANQDRAVLDTWISLQQAAQVLTTSTTAAEAELGAWLEYLGPAADGEAWAETELYKLVALHARELGARGKPTSVTVVQVLLLQDVLEAQGMRSPGFDRVLRELLRVVVDAQTLGQTERLSSHHLRALREGSPVVRIGRDVVLGFYVGPMDRDNIDAMFGRMMREGIGVGAKLLILDMRGAAQDDETFHRTLAGFTRSEVASRLELVVTGLEDAARTSAALAALGVDRARLRIEADVSQVLDTCLGLTAEP